MTGAKLPNNLTQRACYASGVTLRARRLPWNLAFRGDAVMVSRKHAEIRWDNDRWHLVDLNASYGTFLEGRRISAPAQLSAGQVIQFGTDGP